MKGCDNGEGLEIAARFASQFVSLRLDGRIGGEFFVRGLLIGL